MNLYRLTWKTNVGMYVLAEDFGEAQRLGQEWAERDTTNQDRPVGAGRGPVRTMELVATTDGDFLFHQKLLM